MPNSKKARVFDTGVREPFESACQVVLPGLPRVRRGGGGVNIQPGGSIVSGHPGLQVCGSDLYYLILGSYVGYRLKFYAAASVGGHPFSCNLEGRMRIKGCVDPWKDLGSVAITSRATRLSLEEAGFCISEPPWPLAICPHLRIPHHCGSAGEGELRGRLVL